MTAGEDGNLVNRSVSACVRYLREKDRVMEWWSGGVGECRVSVE